MAMSLQEVDVFFKKNKRRLGLLICSSIAILWFLTIAVTITPWISCPEDSDIDFNPFNNDEKNIEAHPNEKPNTSRKMNEFTRFRYTRDVSSARHQRQLNPTSFESSAVNQPVNSKLLTRNANRGYILRIRKYDARKRRERYRRDSDGSGHISEPISEVTEITPTFSIDSTSTRHDYVVTNAKDEGNSNNATSLKSGNAINTTPSIKTAAATTKPTTTATTITTAKPTTNPILESENATNTTLPPSSSKPRYKHTTTTTKPATTTTTITTAKPATSPILESKNATNTTRRPGNNPTTTITTKPTTTTTITATKPTTTTINPCEDTNLVPTNVRFPPNNVLAYQMNVRITAPTKKAILYNVTISHNRDVVQNLIEKNVSVKVFKITGLKPCRHYIACVVASFEECPDSEMSCNATSTATNVTNVEITNVTVQIGANNATISFDRPDTDCKLNFTIKVNYTCWKFNAEDSFALISSNATNNDSVRWISDSSSDNLEFEVMDLSTYTSYIIEVSAESASSKTEKANRTIKTNPSAPTQVKNVSCILNSAGVTWEPPENFNGEFQHYLISVCLKNGTKCKQVQRNITFESIFNISFPEPGKRYTFEIQAKTKDVDEYGKKLKTSCSTPMRETVVAAPSGDPSVLIVAWIFTCILLIILLVFLVIALKRKKIIKLPMVQKWRRSGQSSRNTRSVAIPFRVTSKPVQLVDFEEHYRTMIADSSFKFSQEFDELVSGSPSCPTTAALMSENRVKNRWVNILPFDHSRVKLLPIADDIFTDYINASYIPGYKSQREFIASQGPLSNTKDDFWRMIWEQNSSMIVMVTQCIERGKEKCEKYWPEDNETHYYGDLAVKLKSESILTGYTLRIFDLHLKMPMTTSPTEIDLSDLLELIPRSPEIEKGSRTMEVKQMHFTMWPDFGCPENTSLLINFVGSVRDHIPHDSTGPIIVHCSAGVGRTGTFIAVDKLMQHIEDHDFVDIFGTVREMRNYRTNMVQTEDQYMYIHECVKDLLIDMQTRTPIDKNSGESMIDIIGMAQAETPSRKRRTETSGCDQSETEMTETTVLLSVTTGASDLTDTVFSELTDTTSVISDHAFAEPEPDGDADKLDQAFVIESPQLRLSCTNSMSHDPNDTLLRAAVDEEYPSLQETEKTLSDDSTDIPLSSLAERRLNMKTDTWYF